MRVDALTLRLYDKVYALTLIDDRSYDSSVSSSLTNVLVHTPFAQHDGIRVLKVDLLIILHHGERQGHRYQGLRRYGKDVDNVLMAQKTEHYSQRSLQPLFNRSVTPEATSKRFSKWRFAIILAILACLQIVKTISSHPAAPVRFPDLYEASIAELQEGLDAGYFSSVDLVKVCSFI